MSDNVMPAIVRPAKPGSKKDWVTVSGEIPPELAVTWRALMDRRAVYQSDLVHEAVALLVRSEERKGRRVEKAGRRATDLAPDAAA